MKIKVQQFLFGKSHSWAICGKNLARSFIKSGHEVDLVSTDGVEDKYVEEDLRPFIKSNDYIKNKIYDLQLSYTAMINFNSYLSNGTKNRFGIWNYEFTVIPNGFAKHYKSTDLMLPSSKFSFDIFANNGVPEQHMRVIPHGVDFERFQNAEPYPLKTKKNIKLFANIAQPHTRKNITGMLNAFGKAFTKQDDVCFILKVVDKAPSHNFEEKFSDIFNKFKSKYPNHAEVEIINTYIPKIESLYKSVDILFMIPNAECFFFPALEILADKKIVITSNYGGQLDYLTKDNSFLVDGKIVQAPRNAHYWSSSVYSNMFNPDIDDAVDKLRYCVNNFETAQAKVKQNISNDLYKKYSWNNVTKEIEKLCK